MHTTRIAVIGAIVAFCTPTLFAQTAQSIAHAATQPATARPADADWPIAAKDYTSQRFSRLDQITTQNVSSLKAAWSFDTGVHRGHEEAPIVVGSTLYLATPFPHKLFAFDLTKPGSVKWTFEPKPDPAAQGQVCCDSVTRGAAYADGNVIINTIDCQTIVVDADTGREVWRTRMDQPSLGESMNMAPFVVRDKVIVGSAGGQFGARGWAAALDVATGRVVWKAYSTGPDADCLIGPNFKPFYAMDRGKELGVTTWPPDQWKIGGGAVWGWISYDPELDLIYYGTGDPASWNADVRPGDNKWASGIFARRPDSGEAIWFYQVTAHDLFGHDSINECTLVDLVRSPGESPRKVLLHADRNGHLYVLDRTSGEVSSATPFVRVNGMAGVDLQSGAVAVRRR